MSLVLLLLVSAQAQEGNFPTSDVSEDNDLITMDAELPQTVPEAALTWDDLAPSQPDSPAIRQTSSPALPPWLLLTLGIGLVGAAWALRRRLLSSLSGDIESSPMNIVSRQTLGHHSSLLVVDVMDLDGSPRRLVVGTGQGAPSLVADISAPTLIFDDTHVDEPNLESIPAVETMNGDSIQVVETPLDVDIAPSQRQAAQALVDELLAQREGYGRSLRGSRINVTA